MVDKRNEILRNWWHRYSVCWKHFREEKQNKNKIKPWEMIESSTTSIWKETTTQFLGWIEVEEMRVVSGHVERADFRILFWFRIFSVLCTSSQGLVGNMYNFYSIDILLVYTDTVGGRREYVCSLVPRGKLSFYFNRKLIGVRLENVFAPFLYTILYTISCYV